jgi:hypothetical protein
MPGWSGGAIIAAGILASWDALRARAALSPPIRTTLKPLKMQAAPGAQAPCASSVQIFDEVPAGKQGEQALE